VCTVITKYGTPPLTDGNCAARNMSVTAYAVRMSSPRSARSRMKLRRTILGSVNTSCRYPTSGST